MKGQIKYLNRLNRYGFLKEDHSDCEYYFRFDQVRYENFKEGNSVEFDVRPSRTRDSNYLESYNILKL